MRSAIDIRSDEPMSATGRIRWRAGRGRGDHRSTTGFSKEVTTMKIATYGAMHLGVAFGVAWALTGDVAIAGAIALVEPAVQTLAYAIHERAWRDPASIGTAARRALARWHRGVEPERVPIRAVAR
jgi:uncharacterized membrane protein